MLRVLLFIYIISADGNNFANTILNELWVSADLFQVQTYILQGIEKDKTGGFNSDSLKIQQAMIVCCQEKQN